MIHKFIKSLLSLEIFFEAYMFRNDKIIWVPIKWSLIRLVLKERPKIPIYRLKQIIPYESTSINDRLINVGLHDFIKSQSLCC